MDLYMNEFTLTKDQLPERTAPKSGAYVSVPVRIRLQLPSLKGALCADDRYPRSYWWVDEQWDLGKAICAQCPARAECLNESIRLGETHSYLWAGLTPRERQNEAERRRRTPR